MAHDVVAILRQEAARDAHNRDLSNLVGGLSTKSEDFRTMWAAQNVKLHRAGIKQFHHPVVRDFELNYQAMQLPGDEGLTHRLQRRAGHSGARRAQPPRHLGRDTPQRGQTQYC